MVVREVRLRLMENPAQDIRIGSGRAGIWTQACVIPDHAFPMSAF